MFAKPTINDFSSWIRWHLDNAAKDVEQRITKVEREHSAVGRYHSGATISRTLDIVEDGFENGLNAALGELARATRITKIPRDDLRSSAEEELHNFVKRTKAIANPEKLEKIAGKRIAVVEERLAELETKLTFALRQFDVGFLQPIEPEIPESMSNKINIGTMYGGAIQQGANDLTQSTSSVLNIESAKAAVNNYEAALNAASIPNDKLAEIMADLNTIKAQLSKSTPSRTILAEAGHSLRNISEGIVASGIAPQLIPVAMALCAAIGIN